MHDQLDLLVAEAYGWPADLSDEDILARLVALNAKRAKPRSSEALVRWLRPEYHSALIGAAEHGARGAARRTGIEAPLVAAAEKTQKPSFPANAVERTATVFAALSDARGPLDAKILARAFRQGAKVEHAIARVLASLARLGHIYTADGRDYALRRRA